jgi:hypothetical protein
MHRQSNSFCYVDVALALARQLWEFLLVTTSCIVIWSDCKFQKSLPTNQIACFLMGTAIPGDQRFDMLRIQLSRFTSCGLHTLCIESIDN